jgi:DNA-binding response OmpR family regulator
MAIALVPVSAATAREGGSQGNMNAHSTNMATSDFDVTKDPRPQRASPPLLLVEDDDDIRCLCAAVLRNAGFDVRECPTLESAYLAFEEEAPAVLLLDRELPDGSGLELARWVRSRESYDGVHVIAFSGRQSPVDVEAALGAGCDAFVGKPCAPATLVAEVRRTATMPPPRDRRGRPRSG